MTLAAPSVYIGTQLMDSLAVSDMPVLSGLKFAWGNEEQVEFDAPKTLSCQLLIRTPSNTDFLAKGVAFGLMIGGTTVWAGRIATLTARPDQRKKDALLISLTASDTLADLAAYRKTVDWYTTGQTGTSKNAAARRAELAAALPPGWTMDGPTPNSWTTVRPQRWNQEPYLNMLDMHLRSTVARRHITTRYVPGTGLAPRITIADERAKAAPTETLTATPEWSMSTAAPANSGFVKLAGNMVDREVEWEKTPDDTVTDIQLSSTGLEWGWDEAAQAVIPGEKSESSETWNWQAYNNYGNPGIDFAGIAAMQAQHGFHQAEFDIDSLGGNSNSGDPHISLIVNYWLDADAQWRPTGVTVPDSRRLPDATALALLDVAKRYKAYATVDGLPANNPAGGSRVRAYIIAGEAEWTGKKWKFALTFGRVPRAPATGGVLTFDSIATHPDPDISNATAETVGDTITFADFAYIGA